MAILIDPTVEAPGNTLPTGAGGLAVHTAPPDHFNPAQEFINVTSVAAHNSTPNNSVQLALDPVTNLPAEIAAGQTGVRANHDWSQFTTNNPVFGKYVIRHSLDEDAPGQYTVEVTNATVLSTAPGRIVIEILAPVQWRIDVMGAAGPMPNGWTIETIKLTNEAAYDNEALEAYDPARVFVPEFLTEMSKWKFTQKRFMKTMATESGLIREVGEYPLNVTHNLLYGGGRVYPLAVMVELCNQFDIDPYFNLWVDASDALVDWFASYVADNLKPSLTAYVGCHNEYWNSVYQANDYVHGEGLTRLGVQGPGTLSLDAANRRITATGVDLLSILSGSLGRLVIDGFAYTVDVDGNSAQGIPAATSDTVYIVNYLNQGYLRDYTDEPYWHNPNDNKLYADEGYTIVTTKQLKRWTNIFEAAGKRNRLVCVWETQMAGVNRLSKLLDSSYWAGAADYIDPLTVIDAVAVNPYFGSGIFKRAGVDSEGAWIDNAFTAHVRPMAVSGDYAGFSQALRDYMFDVPIPGVPLSNRSITDYILRQSKNWREALRGTGLRLLAYEGSAHIIHSVLDPSNRPTDADIVDAYANGFLQSPEAEDVFRLWAEAHVRWFDGPVMQFNLAQPISRFGAYGLVPYWGGPSDKRQDVLLGEYVNRAPWWSENLPPQSVVVTPQTWSAGSDPAFTLDDYVSNNATSFEGTPPAGMTLDTATGALTGAPTAAAAADYTFAALNASGSIDVVVNIGVS